MNNTIEVKCKKIHSDAVIPSYAHSGDGCMDLTATSVKNTGKYIEYGTGIALEIPNGYVGLLFPRSSNSKKDLVLCNSVGVIDHQYRGEICARFKVTTTFDSAPFEIYDIGERVAQIMIIPRPEVCFVESDILEDSVRGEGGFGSTGS